MFLHKIIVAFSCMLLLSSCGFHPLYKKDTEGSARLYQIKIDTIPDREGQLLHNALSTLLTPYGPPAHPLYVLFVSITFVSRGIALQKDATTSQEVIDLRFNLVLSDFKTGKKLYSTTETVSVDNSISLNAPYSNLIEERSLKRRLIEEAAQSIRLHLVSFLSADQ